MAIPRNNDVAAIAQDRALGSQRKKGGPPGGGRKPGGPNGPARGRGLRAPIVRGGDDGDSRRMPLGRSGVKKGSTDRGFSGLIPSTVMAGLVPAISLRG